MAYNNGYYNNGMNGYQQPNFNNGAMPDQLAQYRAQYQQPIPQQPQQFPMQQSLGQQATAQTSGNGVIWVQGEAGAKAYMVAPGNSVMLMDSENPVVYLKSVDMSGMPSMRIFDLKERVPYVKEPSVMSSFPTEMIDYITRDEFNKLEDKINALLAKENEQDSTVKIAESGKFANKGKEEKRNG